MITARAVLDPATADPPGPDPRATAAWVVDDGSPTHRSRTHGRGRAARPNRPSRGPAVGQQRQQQAALALALLATTQFVLILDAAVVGVALPPIAAELGLSPAQLSWVPNAYTLLFGGFLLLGGRAADLLGRRGTFVAGMLAFALASLLGALASNGPWLVAARAAQGLAAAFVSPAALALILSAFPDERARTRALGAWAAVGAAGGAAGFLLGGVLVAALGWRSVLYVNVPIGVAVAWLAPRLVPQPPAQRAAAAFDLAGAATVTGGLALLIYALVDGGAAGWTAPQTLAALGAAALLLAAFVLVERGAASPLVPLPLARRGSFLTAMGLAGMITASIVPMFFFLSLYTQQVLGYSPLAAGLAQLPVSLLITAAALLGPRLIARIGARNALLGGLTLMALGLAWLSRWMAEGGYVASILGPALLIGPGAGTVWVAASVVATAGAGAHESGLYSGVPNAVQQLGGAVGLALLTALATWASTGAGGAGGTPGAAALAAAAVVLGWARLSDRRRAAQIAAYSRPAPRGLV